MSQKQSSILAVALLVIGLIVGSAIGVLSKQGEINRLQEQIGELQSKTSDLQNQVNSLNMQIEDLKNENSKLKSENNQLKNDNTQLQSQLNSIKTENEELKKQNQELQSIVMQVKSENEELMKLNIQLNEELEEAKKAGAIVQKVIVKQDPGKLVYWVLPGERRLSPSVFGTIDNPMFGTARLKWAIEEAMRLPPPLNESVVRLLQQLPFLVAAPDNLREVRDDGYMYLTAPTLFSDKARIVSGSMYIEYIDKMPYDLPGPPTNTPDDAKANITFTDPAGNTYQLVLRKVIMPPIPGYETGGGVIVNAWHHGTTGTGSPLMPRVYAYAALWAVGDVIMNGEVIEESVAIHIMTTQVVRDKNYKLAIDEELPLSPGNTPAGQIHHTHVVVMPIKVTSQGPVFHPLNIGFKLPNGKPQPFIHIMYEQDVIVQGPFANWIMPQFMKPQEKQNATVEIIVKGSEWKFEPNTITVKKGQEVTIIFVNEGTIPHNLYISGYNVKTQTIGPGKSVKITFTADREGEFTFWCTIPGHREAGMEGKLVVKP